MNCQSCYSTFFDPGTVPVTPVPELLGTWDVPSPAEVETIRHTLGETQDAMQAIRAKISYLNKAVAALEQRNAELEYLYTSHAQLISVWQRVPPEIWVKIFLECLTLYTREPDYTQMSVDYCASATCHPDSVPLTLLRVCRRWKEIVLGTPLLWAYFALTQKTPHYQKCLAKHLSIAGDCLLSVALTIPSLPVTYGPNVVSIDFEDDSKDLIPVDDPAVTSVLSKSANWEHLTLLCYGDKTLPGLAPALSNLPYLRSLTLLWDSKDDYRIPENLKVFSNVPLLREVKLRICRPSSLPALRLPWMQLTSLSLDLTKGTFSLWHGIVSLCPQLVTFALIILAAFLDDDESERSKILFPRLRNFGLKVVPTPTVTSAIRDGMYIILRRLSCPSVEECKLFGPTTNKGGIIQEFLSGISGTLTSFHTDMHCGGKGELLKWLAATPNIVELAVNDSDCQSDYQWVRSITGPTTPDDPTDFVEGMDNALVPNLKRFRVTYQKPDNGILDMLRRRVDGDAASPDPATRANTHLESVRITLTTGIPSPEFIAELKALQERGLVVVLLGSMPPHLPPMTLRTPGGGGKEVSDRVRYI